MISKVVEASQPMPFHSEKSLHIHKVLFEYLVSDCVPWNAINGPGFQRLCHELNPRFQVASESYYRSLLEPTFEKLKKKIFLEGGVTDCEYVRYRNLSWVPETAT